MPTSSRERTEPSSPSPTTMFLKRRSVCFLKEKKHGRSTYCFRKLGLIFATNNLTCMHCCIPCCTLRTYCAKLPDRVAGRNQMHPGLVSATHVMGWGQKQHILEIRSGCPFCYLLALKKSCMLPVQQQYTAAVAYRFEFEIEVEIYPLLRYTSSIVHSSTLNSQQRRLHTRKGSSR